MRGGFFSLLMILAMLLGSTHVSALAHVHDVSSSQAMALADTDHHSVDLTDPADDAPEQKGDVVQHHHCSVSLIDPAAGICEQRSPDGTKPFPARAAMLASISSAPPTQPPAA